MLYFDTTRILEWQGRYTGMEVVAFELASEIQRNSGRLVYFIPGKGFVDVTDDVIWSDHSLLYPFVRQGSIKSMIKARPLQLPEELRRRRALKSFEAVEFTSMDTFFTSDGLWDRKEYIEAVEEVSNRNVRIVHLVHDIVPIIVPHLVHGYMTEAMNGYFRRIAPVVDMLISISKNTERDFLQTFKPIMKPGVVTYIFHHGDDVPRAKPERPERLKSVKDFLLCVGTIEIRKNHHLLYQVYKLAAEKQIELPPIVIIGRDGWLADQTLKLMRDDPEVKDKFIFLGPAPDSELVWCYENCLFTIMPSYYEGWGLPVAQSLYFGKVAAASSSGPLPEVGGSLNLYFSPYNAEECLGVIKQLLDSSARSKLEARIREEYSKTTWQAAAAGAIDALQS